MASFEAKINYIVKVLGRPLAQEPKAFPLLLKYNYNSVIKPRCELIKDKVKRFEFYEVLPLTDEQFCAAYDVPMEELENKIKERSQKEEKDILWAYVPGI